MTTLLLMLKGSLSRTTSSQRIMLFSVCRRQSLGVTTTNISLGAPRKVPTATYLPTRHVSSSFTNVEKLTRLTRQILNTSGPLSNRAWEAAETAFDMWTSYPVSQHQGVEWAWNLLDRLVASEFSSNNNKQLTSGWIHRIIRVYLENEELAVDPDMIMEKLESYAPVLIVDNKTRALLKSIEYRTVMVNGHEQSMNLSLEPVLMKPAASLEPKKVANDNALSCTSQESKHGAVTPQSFDKKRNAAMTWDDEQHTPISMLDMNKPIGSMNALDWMSAQNALAHETCCRHCFHVDKSFDSRGSTTRHYRMAQSSC